MSTFVFHNNFHRYNHHTVLLDGFPESASDPIASIEFPFQGLFYNNCIDDAQNFIGLSNSYDWWTTYVTVTSNYIEWGKYPTTYTTVKSNSANWHNLKPLYITYNSLSSKWNSMYDTYDTNVNQWITKFDGYQMYTDKIQENTKQKTFSASFINTQNIDNIVWDLTAAQVGMYVATNNANFSGFRGAKKGGIYNLILITDALCLSSLTVTFESNYFRFPEDESYSMYPDKTYSFSVTGVHLRKFQFLSDGRYLIGKHVLYDITPPEENVYYSGAGIKIYENSNYINPIILDNNQAFSNAFGNSLIINGSDPYDSSSSVAITRSEYNRDFIFTFTSLSALSSGPLHDASLGSEDKINVINPNLTIINSLSSSNSLTLKKCDTYDSIEIFTRAYGYISELTVNDVQVNDFIFDKNGYTNHETGHIISTKPDYTSSRTQSIFVKFGEPVPILTEKLSAGISLWLDAMDYSTVKFLSSGNNNNYVIALSSRLSGYKMNFTSTSGANTLYNTSPKQSFNYNLASTHYRNLVLSGNIDFVTFTVLTPSTFPSTTEWLWNNGKYGIFKIAGQYSLGIGTDTEYYIYDYGVNNVNKPILIATRYSNTYKTQECFINGSSVTNLMSLSTSFGLSNNYTMIGGLNPSNGFSEYKLHEFILYKEYKSDQEIYQIKNYLLDKWKFL